MKKYNWTIDDIKDRYKLLQKMKREEKNPHKLELIYQDIEEIANYLLDVENPEKEDMPKLLDSYAIAKSELVPRRYMWGDLELFRDETSSSLTIAPILKRNSLSKKDILDLTHDFYKSCLDKNLFHFFLKNFRRRYDHMMFTREQIDPNCMGESLNILSLGESFISSFRDYTIEDVLTTIHEYSHATSAVINPSSLCGDNHTFCEIEPLFMEMIGANYLESIFKNGEATGARAGIHEIQCCSADVLASKIGLIKAEENFYGGKYKSNKELKEGAKKHLGLSSEETDDIIQIGTTSYDYLISYLFAIELYSIYQSDRDKAIDTLKRIINLDCKSELEYFKSLKRMGLIPAYSLREYHRDINESVRKLEKKNI